MWLKRLYKKQGVLEHHKLKKKEAGSRKLIMKEEETIFRLVCGVE